MTTPKRFVLCFSSKDADGKAELVAHLAAAREALSIWSVDGVPPGESIPTAFREAAASADAALLLLSADFFAELDKPPPSEPAEHSLAWQVEELRRQHKERKLRLVPIVWRACDWRASDWLAALKPMPLDVSAIAPHDKAQRDRMWAEIARQLSGRERPTMRGILGRMGREAGIEMPSRETLIAKSQNLLAMNEAAFEKEVDLSLGVQQVPQLVRAQHVAHGGARGLEEVRPLDENLLDYLLRVERLLLVGQPGAGKTQTLRDLCSRLLSVAIEDPSLPVPFIVNFSTFSRFRGGLRAWLAEGLKESAAIPLAIGRTLLEQGQLFLLLDGLDEMAAERRAGALAELNALMSAADPALSRCVVCSRTLEYAEANVPLMLPAALELQPLNPSQVLDALAHAGPAAPPVRTAIARDQALVPLLQTPLLLTVAVRAFAGTPVVDLAGHSPSELRQRLYDAYVTQMLRRITTKQDATSTLHWLRWLSRHLTLESLSLLLIERLQPSGLAKEYIYRIVYRVGRALISGVSMLIVFIIAFGLANMLDLRVLCAALSVAAIASLGIGLGLELVGGLGFGLGAGPVLGLIFALLFPDPTGVKQGLGISSILGAILLGPLIGLIVGLVGKLRPEKIEPVEHLRWSWAQTKSYYRSHLAVGSGLGLLVGLSMGVFGEMGFGANGGLSAGLSFGLAFGLARFVMKGWVKAMHERSARPNEGIRSSVHNGLQEGCGTGILVGFGFGVGVALSDGLSDGARMGLGTGAVFSVAVGVGGGIGQALKHYILRLFLWRENKLPLRLVPWLESCRARLLLRRQGGAYMFWHKTLQDYFADLDDERLADLAKRIDAKPEYVQSY